MKCGPADIYSSTASPWLNLYSSSRELKNVKQKQKQAPRRQTDGVHSRNQSVSAQPVSNENTHTHTQSPSLNSLCKCRFTTQMHPLCGQSNRNSTMCRGPFTGCWSMKARTGRGLLRRNGAKSRTCIPSNQHNFHSLPLSLLCCYRLTWRR